MRFNHTVSDCL
jgi:hypothetical protein